MSTIALRSRTLVLAVGASALIGAGTRGLLASPPTPRPNPTIAQATPGPHSETAGIPTGFARSQAGAIAAASTYVRQGQRIFNLPADARTAALLAVASRAASTAYLAQVSAQLAELDGIAARGHGHLIWDVSVLATRADAYTSQRARVSVWRVGVLSVGGLTSPLSEWTIVDYELVWERSDWRIWSETQTPGPTPMGHPDAHPSNPGQFDAALAGFTRYPGLDPL